MQLQAVKKADRGVVNAFRRAKNRLDGSIVRRQLKRKGPIGDKSR